MESCSAFYNIYMMLVVHVSVISLYPSRNDGGPHRNCTLYTRGIRVPSAFLSWQSDDSSCYIKQVIAMSNIKQKTH